MGEIVKRKGEEIVLIGRIDSVNAADAEKKILEALDEGGMDQVVLDASELEYISSAGLRILLHIKKDRGDLTIKNVSSDIYEILDMTGFTEILNVEKAYKEISIEGGEIIGRGANGTIYRVQQDTVVKVYNNSDALDEIQHERTVAKLALILGIPTAISYDVVKVGDSFGSVFEFLNARSFSKIIATESEKLDWCVHEYVRMLKIIHETIVPEGKLPDMKETVLSWAGFMQDHLPPEAGKKLLDMVKNVPHDNHMIHGDYHTQNLVLQDDEVLLIDMDTLAVGNPIFELASMFNAFIGFYESDHELIKDFQGYDFETSQIFWHKTLQTYLETEDEDYVRSVEDKARILGYTRLIRRSIRRGGLETEEGRAEIDRWKEELLKLLDRVDELTFERKEETEQDSGELEVEASEENLPEVIEFVNKHLQGTDCSPKAQMQIDLAVEEIFVNIAKYAYAPSIGKAKVRVEVTDDPVTITITFIDKGRPYDPLAKEDPDVTLPAEVRQIGGLGIFMTKKAMDDIEYEYENGQNILHLKKTLSE